MHLEEFCGVYWCLNRLKIQLHTFIAFINLRGLFLVGVWMLLNTPSLSGRKRFKTFAAMLHIMQGGVASLVVLRLLASLSDLSLSYESWSHQLSLKRFANQEFVYFPHLSQFFVDDHLSINFTITCSPTVRCYVWSHFWRLTCLKQFGLIFEWTGYIAYISFYPYINSFTQGFTISCGRHH